MKLSRLAVFLLLVAVVLTGAQCVAQTLPGGGALNPQNSYCFNCDPTLIPHWRAALGRVRSGVGNARLLAAGDSITFGQYSNNSLTGDWITKSWPHQLSSLFSGHGVNANSNSFFGFGNYLNNPAVTYVGGWTGDPTPSVGGYVTAGTVSGAILQVSTTTNVDTFRVWHFTYPGGAMVSYNVNGGSTLGTSNYAGSAAYVSDTVSAPSLIQNTLNVVWTGTGHAWVSGIEAYNSSISQVIVMNAGWPASTSANWTGAGGIGPSSGITAIGADLTLLSLQVNDWCGAVPVSTFTSNMQSIITAAKAGGGDVVLLSEPPTSPGAVGSCPNNAVQANYVSAMYSLATSNNIPLIDVFNRWQSYAASFPMGLYYSTNGVHPGSIGYSDMAAAIYNFIGQP